MQSLDSVDVSFVDPGVADHPAAQLGPFDRLGLREILPECFHKWIAISKQPERDSKESCPYKEIVCLEISFINAKLFVKRSANYKLPAVAALFLKQPERYGDREFRAVECP